MLSKGDYSDFFHCAFLVVLMGIHIFIDEGYYNKHFQFSQLSVSVHGIGKSKSQFI
jgi:hypothetical protein